MQQIHTLILYTKNIETPIGTLFAAANEKGIFTAMSSELKALYLKAQIKRLQAELKREDFERLEDTYYEQTIQI